jgi:hypothetical protein
MNLACKIPPSTLSAWAPVKRRISQSVTIIIWFFGKRKITDAFAFDIHFTIAGFIQLPE